MLAMIFHLSSILYIGVHKMPEHWVTLCKCHTRGTGCISAFTGLTNWAYALKCKKSIGRTTKENSFRYMAGYVCYAPSKFGKNKKKRQKNLGQKCLSSATRLLQKKSEVNNYTSALRNAKPAWTIQDQRNIICQETKAVPILGNGKISTGMLILGLCPDVRFAATARCGLLG